MSHLQVASGILAHATYPTMFALFQSLIVSYDKARFRALVYMASRENTILTDSCWRK